jgi:hypothetical protein
VNEFWAHHDLDRCTSLEQSFMSNVDLALSVMPGIGLAAATGFRVFLPMLIVSAAAYRGISSATRFRMRWRLTGRLGRQDSNFCIRNRAPRWAYRYHAARRVAEDRASDAAFFARGDLFDISHLRTPERQGPGRACHEGKGDGGCGESHGRLGSRTGYSPQTNSNSRSY